MECRITYGDNNQILYIEAPNGEASGLFQQAVEVTATPQEALDVWKAGNSEMYRTEVMEPQNEQYKAFVFKQLNTISPAQNPVQLIHKGNQVEVNLDTVDYDFQNTKQGSTIISSTKIGKTKVALGRLRLTPFLDGVKIDSVLVYDNDVYNGGKIEKIKGVGTELYKEALFSLVSQNTPLYSDTMRTEGAEGIWNKLKSVGIVTQRGKQYKVSPHPATVDQNGEPIVEEVLKFIDRKNSDSVLSEEDVNALRLSMIGTSVQNSEDLRNTIRRGFFTDGIFAPTKASLKNSGLYTETEIQTVLTNQQLQDKIKDLYYKLQNSTDEIENEIYVNYDFITSSTFNINMIGKYEIDNPYINEKEAIEILGGVRTIEEFEDRLANSDLEYLKEQYKGDNNLYEFFKDFNSVPVKTYVDGELTNKSKSNTQALFEQTLLEPENNTLQRRLQILGSVSPSVWETSPQEVKLLLEDLQQEAENISLDLTGIDELYNVRTQADFRSFMGALNNLLSNTTQSNLENLSAAYDEFFGMDTTEERAVVQVPIQHRNKSLISLNTTATPYELFAAHGLLSIQNNVWQKTNGNTATMEGTYNIVYETAKINPSILPREAYGEAVLDKGTFDRSRLAKKRDQVLVSIKDWTYKKMKSISTGNLEVDTDTLQKMVLYSQFYSTPLEAEVTAPTAEQDMQVAQISNKDYLLNGDFTGEFHKEMLREKRKNSKAFKEFYSNFTIDAQGITLKNTDPITRAQITPYLLKNEDIRNYLFLRKDTDLAVAADVNFVDSGFMRQYYRNYPQVLTEISGDFQRINPTTVVAQTKENFVKVNGVAYEQTASTGDKVFYSSLGKNSSIFKEYNKTSSAPTLTVNPLAYIANYTAPVTETKHLYNNNQSQEIENQLNC